MSDGGQTSFGLVDFGMAVDTRAWLGSKEA